MKRQGFGWMCLVAAALSCGAQVRGSGPAASKSVPMKTFRDAVDGVSFQYPAAWVLSRAGAFYDSGSLTDDADRKPLAVVTFFAKGNFYARTNLSGLEFTYDVLPLPTQKACEAILLEHSGPMASGPDRMTINGIPFAHVDDSGAGMCHQMSGDLYVHYREGKCFVFEAGMHTICAGVQEGTRALTAAEVKALTRHLDGVIQTVTLGTPR